MTQSLNEQLLSAVLTADDSRKLRAIQMLNGTAPAATGAGAEPFLTLKQVAQSVGQHYSSLTDKCIKDACAHFQLSGWPKYRLSEVIRWLDTGYDIKGRFWEFKKGIGFLSKTRRIA